MDNFENSSRKFPSNAYKLTQNFVEKELNLVGSNFYRLSGYDFLHFISELCAQLTGFNCVYIADFNSESNNITIKAGIENGKRAEIAEFNSNGKPIKHILHNQFVIYPENVQTKFPEDTELKKHNIQGFAGVPLLNKNGDVLGMFYAYHSKVITDIESIETYLKLFSGRISSELNLIKKEELLIRSEKKYQTLFESADDAINIIKGIDYVDCNVKTLKTFGCRSKNDFIGKTILDFSLEKQPDGSLSKEKAQHLINETLKGNPQRFYWQHCRKDKSVFDTEVSLNPLQIEGATHFQAIVRDISVQKQSHELARKLSTAVEQSSASIVITNISGEIEYVNPKFTEVTGYTFKEVAGEKPSIVKSGYTNDEEYEVLWKTILAGKIWKGEFKNVKKNGDFYWESASIAPITNEFGNITHFVAIKEDITDRIKVEELLKQSEERYRSVFENLHDVLYITDLNGTILELSPSIQFHFGYDRDKLLGKSVYDVYYDASEREKFLNTIKQKGLVNDYELALKNEYGEKVYCSANARLIFDENGKPVQVEGIIRNITGRKLNEKKLQLSERRFRQAQEIAKIGTFEFDIKNGIYWGSVEAKKIFGFSIDDDNFPVKQVRECYVDKEKTGAMIDDAHKNLDSYNYEYDIFTYDTHERKTINSIAEIKRNKEGKPEKVLGLIVDVTEKKQIEKELITAKERAEENEKKLKEASEIAKLGSWEFDIETKLFTFTDNFYKIFHTSTTEMGGYQMTIEDYYKQFIHPDDAHLVAKETKKAVESTNPNFSNYFEHKIVYKDGGTGYIGVRFFMAKDKFSNSIKCYGVNQDITEIKIAEQELIKAKERAEKSEYFYKIMNNNLPLGAHHYKLNNEGKLIFVMANPAANKILGIDHEPFIGKTIEEAFPNLVQTEVPEKYHEVASTGTTWSTEQITYNDGEIAGAFEVVAFQTIPGNMVAVFSDITSRKQTESELIKAKEKAEESDKLKTAFLLNVSHEIRTPMNGILGFLNLLKQPELSDIEKSGFIDIVNKSGERLMNTINDIVEISKIETGDTNLVIEEIDIYELMQYHFNFFKLEAENKGIGFEIKNQIKADESRIKTDKHKLDGILMNLIKNAVKFTSNGKIEIGNYLENDKLNFYVSDTGCGIPEDKMSVIFERFAQAETGLNRNYEGSGIGLSIVKAHIEALNGEIEVDSTPGIGSTFRFYIPFNPVTSGFIQQNNTDTSHNISDQITILIAEDDEVNTYLMKNMLANDFNLLFATNGEESIQLLHDNPDISLILMDIKMPGKYDGLETTQKIRQFNKKIPIIAQTAYAQSSDKIKAIDAGCNDYISKPFNTNQLKTVIRKYCKVNK